MELDYEDLSEEKRKKYFNSKLFQKYHAYQSLTDGIETVKENDVMFDNLIAGIEGRMSRNLAEDTIKSVLDALVEEVEEHTEVIEEDEDEEAEFP